MVWEGRDIHKEGKQGAVEPIEAAAHRVAFDLDMAGDEVLEDGHSRDDDGIEGYDGADIGNGVVDAHAGTHGVEASHHRC